MTPQQQQHVGQDFRRYGGLIAGMLQAPPTFEPRAESASAVQVERGIVLASLDVGSPRDAVGRLVDLARTGRLADVQVVDAAGHARPVYRPLLIYAWLLSYKQAFETLSSDAFGRWDEALRPWCDLLESELGGLALSDTGTPAIRGGSAAEAAWTALALHLAGKIFVRDAWSDLAADAFGKLFRGQRESGAFLSATASDNPEPMWYHELAILHAAASYAVQAEDRTAARAVARATAFHLAEIQPDHATGQPWGVFAFIWNPPTRPLADQLLHATSLSGRADGVSLILLADALYCLRLFL